MRTNTILAKIVMTMLLLASSAAASDHTLDIFGNANEDETINMQDVTYTELIILEYRDETELADAKYDGKINMQDVTQIELVILGKEKELTLVDDMGDAVTVKKPIESFVYHGHNAYVYETLRAIDAADKIVGISDRFITEGRCRYSENYFPELIGVTNIGVLNTPDYEVVNTLRPDVVLSDEERYYDRIKTPDIPVIAMDVKMEQFTENTRKYGYLFDRRDEAEEYIDWRNGLASMVRERTEGLTDDERPIVYFGATYTPGSATTPIYAEYRGALVRLAGGKNLGDELPGAVGYNKVDPEWIIVRNPDVAIFAAGNTYCGYDIDDASAMAEFRADFLNSPNFAEVNAVTGEQVYIINFPHFVVGGASGMLASVYFAKWLYPDLFEDMDPQEIQQEFVTEFQHIDVDIKEDGTFVYPVS